MFQLTQFTSPARSLVGEHLAGGGRSIADLYNKEMVWGLEGEWMERQGRH